MKKIVSAGLLAILAMLAATGAYAGDVKITKAWTRATAPGQDSASVQMTITSKKDATLVGAASGASKSAELHSMVMEGGMMKMRAMDSLPLPAKTPVTLGEDGNHMMLIGLRAPLKAGHKLPFAITVKFANGKTAIIRALAEIKPLDTAGHTDHMQMQMQPETQQHEHQH